MNTLYIYMYFYAGIVHNTTCEKKKDEALLSLAVGVSM